MSTVKAVQFQHPSASAANITLASDGTVTGGIPSPNRNLLYNGAMQVAQRGTSTASITGGGYYTADRWWTYFAQATGTWTQTIENDAPTGSGFRKSLKMLCTTANSPIDAGDMLQVVQILEGQDLQRVSKGTSSAKKLTISFWVKSNVTGTYIVNLYDNDNTRQVSASYSIGASATWERKTITLPADTTGAFDNDNAGSLFLAFVLAAGSTYTSGSLATTWASYSAGNQAPGQTNLAAATNNYWQVTGVQLETGDVATDFEFKSFGQELRECQRYYYLHGTFGAPIGTGHYYSATQLNCLVQFPVTMRTGPALKVVTGTDYYNVERNSANDGFNSFTISGVSTTAVRIYNSSEVSGTAGQAGYVVGNNAAASLAFDSEL